MNKVLHYMSLAISNTHKASAIIVHLIEEISDVFNFVFCLAVNVSLSVHFTIF